MRQAKWRAYPKKRQRRRLRAFSAIITSKTPSEVLETLMNQSKIWAWAIGAMLILASFAGCQGEQTGGGPVAVDPSPTATTTGDQPGSGGDTTTSAPPNPTDPAAKAPPATAPPTTTPPTASPTPPAKPGARLLRINVRKGDVYRYQVSQKMSGGTAPAGGMAIDATIRMVIDDVGSDQVTMRMTFEKFDSPQFAKAPPEQRKQAEDIYKKLAIIYVIDEKGKSISQRVEGGPPGSEQAFGSLGSGGATAGLPEGPVKVGDTYSSEHKVQGEIVKVTYKVIAFERKNGIDCAKLEMTAALRNTTQTMNIWLELATGMLVVAEGEVPLPGQGEAKMLTTMRRI